MSAPIRVLVVEDSLTVRRMLVDALGAEAGFEVVGEATTSDEAVAKCKALGPDVVTLDMVLDGTSGLAATEGIMADCPTPILVVSASTNRGDLFQTYDALAAGAVDVLEKPQADTDPAGWGERFRAMVRLVARIRVIRHPRAALRSVVRPARAAGGNVRAIGIGASTGGPAAVTEVLRGISLLDVPVVVVVHIGAPFAAAFADWLGAQTGRPVGLAADGEVLGARPVVLAPANRHVLLERGRLCLSDAPPRHSCRPSVDTLFESLAADLGPTVTGCLLTGMGRDGAAGLLAIRRAGGTTLAQDEATSVVWGMPREAVRLGAAEHVVPLHAIGRTIVDCVRGRR